MHCPRHEVAWPASLSILSVLQDWVPEGEHRAAMQDIYVRVIAALELYDIYAQRRLRETEPSEN